MFDDLDLSFALVNETWIREGRSSSRGKSEIETGLGLRIIQKNRESQRGGGVAIIYDDERLRFKEELINTK